MKNILLALAVLVGYSPELTHASEYVIIELDSQGMADNSYPGNLFIGGFVETYRDSVANERKIKNFSKSECLEKLNINTVSILSSHEDAEYLSNGVVSIQGNYLRLVCVSYDDIEKNIDKDFFLEIDKLPKNKQKLIKSQLVVSEVPSYTILPLDEDQKEARKLTEESNKRLLNLIKGK